MTYPVIATIVFLVCCLGVGLIGGLIYLGYLPFKNRLLKSGKLSISRSRQINKAYIIFLFTVPAFVTYIAFFPRDGFYIDEFKNNTGLELPASADIVNKDSWYPDQHGDYWAAAVIKLDESDFAKLKADLSKLSDFQIDTTSNRIGITADYHYLTSGIKETDLDIVFFNTKKEWFKVAFLKDNRTIVFERSSS